MHAVIQRVARASIDVEGTVVGEITRPGLMVLLGVARDGGCEQVAAPARKIAEPHALEGERSIMKADASALVVSRFILYGDTRKGQRPPRSRAAPSEQAEPLVNTLAEDLCARGLHVETEVFDVMMEVSLVNSGPFTVLAEA